MRKVYLGLFAIFFVHSSLLSQQKEAVVLSVAVSDADIDRFTNELTSKTGYNFYYDVRMFDSLRINVAARNERLEKILEQAFHNTGFSFSIDQRNVFITRGKPIRTAL